MSRVRSALAILLLGAVTPLSAAEDAPSSCTASDRLPLGKAWLAKPHTPRTALKLSKVYRAAPKDTGYGVTIRQASRYRIAADRKIWIELTRAGTAIASVSHQRAAACSGIHKIVDFELEPGDYALRFKEAGDADVTCMIVRAP